MKKILLFLSIVLVIIVGLFFLFFNKQKGKEVQSITNFNECVLAGNPVMESYPRQCRTESSDVFVEDIGNELEKDDLIRIDYPRPNQEISSPLKIEGEARGNWFFEASFPITLLNNQGSVIAQGIATAKTDWMTEEFVSFSSDLEFEKQLSGSFGKLFLSKDNPSGLSEYDGFLEVPVIFK